MTYLPDGDRDFGIVAASSISEIKSVLQEEPTAPSVIMLCADCMDRKPSHNRQKRDEIFLYLKKQKRVLYISAALSWIFNQLLSSRLGNNHWLSPLQGEVFMLNGKSACFNDEDTTENTKRLLAGDINLTGCLWGEGESMARDEVLALENSIAQTCEVFKNGLESARLKQERRALRLMPENMSWAINDESLDISFELPAGAFATMVLRECVNVT